MKYLTMKILIISSILLTIFGCFGTDQGEGKFYRYTIKNESGIHLKIKSHLSEFPKVDPLIINLDNGEAITKTYQDGLPPDPYSFGDFFGDGKRNRDSLVIIYNDLRIQFFKGECSENKRNPLNFCIYSGTEVTFIFTEEDYENAKLCGGECQ